jgi:DNA-binding IclR family transcriptional regulator
MPKKAPIDNNSEPIEDDRQFVTSLARGLEILKAFRGGDRLLGNAELVERTRLPKSTVARMTRTLERLDYLRYDPRLEKYKLSTALLSFGYALLRNLEVPRIASSLMRDLAAEGAVNVGIAIADGLDMVYLDTALGGGNNVYRLSTGNIVPMEETAIGQAYFAAQTAERRKALLHEIKAKRPEGYASTKRELDRACEEIAKQGFCIREWQSDIVAAGAPLIDHTGKCEFAINCGAPKFLLDRERLQNEIAPRLVNLAANVRRGLSVGI